MKKIFTSVLLSILIIAGFNSCAQTDKSKRPSPPAKVTETISSGVTVSIDYSQPSLKGRTVGKDVEPKDDTIWRAGANEANEFEVNNDVTIDGKKLPAGKYELFRISNPSEWKLIFD